MAALTIDATSDDDDDDESDDDDDDDDDAVASRWARATVSHAL